MDRVALLGSTVDQSAVRTIASGHVANAWRTQCYGSLKLVANGQGG
jgi:hypothetical protein